MRLGSRPCDYRCGVTIQRDRRPGSLPHPEPSRAPDLDLSLHPTLPCPAHSAIMLTVKYREMLAIACAEKSYGEFRFSSESDAWDWSAMRYVSVFPTGHVKCGFGWLCVRFCRIGYSDCVFWRIGHLWCWFWVWMSVCLFLLRWLGFRRMFSTFFVTFHTFWIKQKGWNRWIPALFDPCERGELNPHEHTLTAT